MPVLAVEGPDGAGKSTLIEALVSAIKDADLTVRVEHFGPPEYDPAKSGTPGEQEFDRLMGTLAKLYEWDEDFVIFDRFHMGCPVYTPFYRKDRDLKEGYGELTFEQYNTVDRALLEAGGKTYIINPPLAVLLDRLDTRGDDFLTTDGAELKRQLKIMSETYAILARVSASAEVLEFAENQHQTDLQVSYVLAGSSLRDLHYDRLNGVTV